MIRNTLKRCAIAVICAAAPALSQAEVRQIANHGAWTVYAGQTDGGRDMCTLLASGSGRHMGMKYFAGDNKLIIHLINNNWTARPGIVVNLTAEFDNRGTWTAQATTFKTTGGDMALEFSIPLQHVSRWVEDFHRSDRLYIRFPDQSNVTDWKVSLDGSDRALAPFAKCIAASGTSL